MGIKRRIRKKFESKRSKIVSMPIVFGESGPRSYLGSIGELETVENGNATCINCGEELAIRTVRHLKEKDGTYLYSCGDNECKSVLKSA